MKKRVLLAGLFHETHTFLQGSTKLVDFKVRRGKEILSAIDEDTPLAGALKAGMDYGWEIIPVMDLRANSGPIVEDKVVELFCQKFEEITCEQLTKGVDGIFLILHGAMVSESINDVEGYVLRKIKDITKHENIPLCGVIDLHTNFTAEMAKNSDGLVAYRKNPHSDAKQTAEDAARLLDRLMSSKEKPQTVWVHPPIMWPPTGTGTETNPMNKLEEMAREIEAENDGILAVNVLAGFAFADTPDTGVSFTAVTVGSENEAKQKLFQLSSYALEKRFLGNVIPPHINEIMSNIQLETKVPIVLIESSDNIGAGAPGDMTGALRALLDHDVKNALCVINDPKSVKEIATVKPGQSKKLMIGGKSSMMDEGPVSLEVKLVSLSDGKFKLEDKHSHLSSMFGSNLEMGPCAVVSHKGLTILLTSQKMPPFDLGQLRSQGLEPQNFSIIVVKAAVGHKQAYDPITGSSYIVDLPGPCSNNLKLFTYHNVKRPIYPLDSLNC